MSDPVKHVPIPNSAPLGGTELILANLKKALPELTDKVQIIMSRPQQVQLEDKPRILWLQDLPQDPASTCLKDASYRTKFNRIVYNSHWQQQQYNIFLGIPFSEGVVIKNGVPLIETTPKLPPGPDNKFKFIYTSTPHRGLAVLAAAADALAKVRTDWELDVYSSFNIYGWHEQDKHWQPLYEALKQVPGVNYHGSRPNAEVREALQKAHCFVYPSIYQESSCMAIQEAMMSGCVAITTNFGVLPETCGEFAWMFSYSEDPQTLVQATYNTMTHLMDNYNSPQVQQVIDVQRFYYQAFYSFERRIPMWKALLEQVITEGVPVEKLVIG